MKWGQTVIFFFLFLIVLWGVNITNKTVFFLTNRVLDWRQWLTFKNLESFVDTHPRGTGLLGTGIIKPVDDALLQAFMFVSHLISPLKMRLFCKILLFILTYCTCVTLAASLASAVDLKCICVMGVKMCKLFILLGLIGLRLFLSTKWNWGYVFNIYFDKLRTRALILGTSWRQTFCVLSWIIPCTMLTLFVLKLSEHPWLS